MKRLREAQVIVPAGIDAHVGADAVAVISSLNFMEAPGNVLAVDIGTNAEIALSSHGRLTTCSAPADRHLRERRSSRGCVVNPERLQV